MKESNQWLLDEVYRTDLTTRELVELLKILTDKLDWAVRVKEEG